MINLLPYEDKKEVEREGLRRFLIVSIFSVSAIFFLIILLMTPIYFYLYTLKTNLLREEVLIKQGEASGKIPEVTSTIKKINYKLAILESASRANSQMEIIKKVLEIKPTEINTSSIYFEAGKISLRGVANTREGLLSYLKILNESGLFSKVDSPVSNILKKTDIDFSISLELKPQQ